MKTDNRKVRVFVWLACVFGSISTCHASNLEGILTGAAEQVLNQSVHVATQKIFYNRDLKYPDVEHMGKTIVDNQIRNAKGRVVVATREAIMNELKAKR